VWSEVEQQPCPAHQPDRIPACGQAAQFLDTAVVAMSRPAAAPKPDPASAAMSAVLSARLPLTVPLCPRRGLWQWAKHVPQVAAHHDRASGQSAALFASCAWLRTVRD
jgi:hypothetical protein